MSKQQQLYESLEAKGYDAHLFNYDTVVGIAAVKDGKKRAVQSPWDMDDEYRRFWRRSVEDIEREMVATLGASPSLRDETE